jgi:hypothetical protein
VLFVLASLAHSPTSVVALCSQRFSIFLFPPSIPFLASAGAHASAMLAKRSARAYVPAALDVLPVSACASGCAIGA